MSLRRLIYLSRIEIPNQRSHSIQMMRTCHAIAQAGVGVDFFVRADEPVDRDAVFEYYGLEPLDNFTLRTLKPHEWEHAAFVRRIFAIARRCGRGTAFYTRDFHLARRLIRLRPLLRLPVFVESHMRDGFFERQSLPQWIDDVVAGRASDPRQTADFRLHNSCYRGADGVVCLLRSTVEALRKNYPDTPAVHAWHGTDPDPDFTYDPDRRHGVYYIGNLYDSYKPETLIEAMRPLTGHELFIVGGNDPADVARARQCAGRAGVADRVHFLGYVPPPQVREHYRRCRVAVTLLAGQKVAEYLSCGLPMVAPELPTIRETLRDGETALLFRLGDTASLAHALRRVLEDSALALRLARAAHAEAAEYAWPKRAACIVSLISQCLDGSAAGGGAPAAAPRRRARRAARRLRRLHYVSRIALPNDHAHSIQMMRTCHALASKGVEVHFYVRGSEPESVRGVLDHYGLEPVEKFRIHWLEPRHWEGARFIARFVPRLLGQGPDAAIYTRDYHLARRFIRLRPLLRMPVVVETHKRDGYFEMGYKTDGAAAVGPDAFDQERRTDPEELIDYAYRYANGVVCVYVDTCRLVAERYPATPVIRAWYDIAPVPELHYDPATRDGICYVGNLYDRYRPGVLVEALSLVAGQQLHTIGGNEPAHLNTLRQLAAEHGVADRLVLEGYVPPSQVQDRFGRFRLAVALLPGLKIAEYFSHGIPIVAPDMPVARDLLRDGETCLLFEPGSAGSLAGAISRILTDPELARRLAAGALNEARKHADPDRATRLTTFIESLL